MNIAITGGSGFLGSEIVRSLIAQKHSVRALCRSNVAEHCLRSLGACPIRGDLNRRDSLTALVRSGDIVIHAAARVQLAGSWTAFRRDIVDGTRRLLEAVLPMRPAQFVYLSSGGVYAAQSARCVYCADHTPAVPARYNFYGRAKRQAEELVQHACDQAGCAWTILRLGVLYGPGGRTVVRTVGRLLERHCLVLVGDGRNRIATLYVGDAARAVIAACGCERAHGKTYDVASDEHVTQRMLLDALADMLGLPHAGRRARRSIAIVAATIAEAVSPALGCTPPFTRTMVDLMSSDQTFDCTRIREELGWRAQASFADGMQRMSQWYDRVRETQSQGAGRDRRGAPAKPVATQ